MAVTSMSTNSIGFGQERYNRASGVNSNLDWCQITTTPTGSFTDADGVWNYWAFKSNGTLTVGRSGRVDYLVVAGGGTGNADNTPTNVGGGGAGGVIVSPAFSRIVAGSYAVTIGSGGAATTSAGTSNDGTNSSLGSLAIAIGGGGASYRAVAGRSGGCGGGGGDDNGVGARPLGGDGTFGQGFRGGQGISNGGAGGGAGGNGTDSGGVGGVGRTVTIIPTSVATSQAVGQVSGGVLYFGGGGGGGQDNAAGGLGGGGAASANDGRSANCPANTGGGSGSSDTTQGAPMAGAGGSGVVIVRTKA